MQLFHKNFSILILLSGTIIMMIIMILSGKPLQTKDTPYGILHLEFAGSPEKVKEVVTLWKTNSSLDNDIVAAANTNTWYDFLFLFFYALFLFSCCSRLAQLVNKKPMASLLTFFAAAALVAGGLDILENAGMLLSLSGNVWHGTSLVTSIASIIKWLLVLGVIASLIIGLLVFIFSKKRKVNWHKLSQPLPGNIQ